MAYDVAGDGPAVVLLHGYPFNRSMWREQVKALSADYKVVAPDLRGHGETEATKNATMYEMARDVAALLDKLNIERASFCGLSMGGYVTFSFYSLFSSRVQSLILADTRPQSDAEETRRVRHEQAQKISEEGMKAVAESLLQKVLTPETLRERPEIVSRVREMIQGTKPEGAVAALRGMAERKDHSYLLERILAPSLVIVGSHDQITPPEVAEKMRRDIPGSRLEIIENAGHLSNIENPNQFNNAVKKFLDAQRWR